MPNRKGYTKQVILVQGAHAGRHGSTDTGIQRTRSWVYEYKMPLQNEEQTLFLYHIINYESLLLERWIPTPVGTRPPAAMPPARE